MVRPLSITAEGYTRDRILTALATYKFLSVKQLHRLGVAKDPSYIRAHLGLLAKLRPALTHRITFPRPDGHGSLAPLHALTPHGADRANEIDKTLRAKGFQNPPAPYQEHDHRVACVDFHIFVRKWAEANEVAVDFYESDYDPSSRRKCTEIPYSMGIKLPDAIFSLTFPDRGPRLFAAEIYLDRRQTRPITQLREYVPLISEKAIERTKGPTDPTERDAQGRARILVLFKEMAAMTKTIEHAEREPKLLANRAAFFLSCPTMMTDFRQHWLRLDGSPTALY